jgi:CspA family cold shock protein
MSQDQTLPCDACGGTFTFSAKEAEFYAEKGFNPPRRCAGARNVRKQTGQNPKYDACPFPGGVAPGGARGGGYGGDRGGSYGGDRPYRPASPRPSFGGGGSRPRPEGMGVFMTGEVAKVIPDRGFGFIRADDGQDFFFDANEFREGGIETLDRGDRVRFELAESPRGPRARDVERA